MVGIDHLRLDGIASFKGSQMDVDHDGSLDTVISYAGGSISLLGVSGISDWNTLVMT